MAALQPTDARENKLAKVKALISSKKVTFSQLIPKHVSLDKVMRLAFTAYQNPKLWDCDPNSLIGAMVDCCRLGLEPDGTEGAFVPYSGIIQFQPMFRGLISLARRSGQVGSVQAFVVYEKDQYKVVLGSEPRIEHEMYTAGDRGKPVFVYCAIGLMDGGRQFDVMTVADVNAIRDRSKAYKNNPNSTPWGTDWDEMAKKTVTKRALKYAPRSVDLAKAIEHDNALEHDGDSPGVSLGWDDLPDAEQAPARKPRETGEVNVSDVVAPAEPPEEARASVASSLQPKQAEIEVDGDNVICEACKKPGPRTVYTVAKDGRAVCPVCEDKGYKLVSSKPKK